MAEETPFIAPEIEETLETIEEDLVPESLPAEREARQQSCQETEAQSVPAALPLEREETQSAPAEPEPKRKPGRPVGAKNKQPAKPRAKRVVVSEAVGAAELRSTAEVQPPPPPAPLPAPRWDAQHRPIPTEAEATTEMAQLMLRLLSGQSMERQRRKDAQRRAWFS
jgi:hypothetical protein